MIPRPARCVLPLLVAAPALADQPAWSTVNGGLAATKFADVDSFTPKTVGRLERAWEVRTGDVSDGSGDLPGTVWSATPLYADGTLHLGTPFHRILALDPATGQERWSYDSRSAPEVLTQPALRNRGVASWESGQDGPCEKRVFLGTMDAHPHAVDADTGAPCEGLGEGGVLDVNQWTTVNAVGPLSLLQPPTVVGDRLLLNWSGKDWDATVTPPATLLAVDVRTGEPLWDPGSIPEGLIPVTGTANIWSSMSADQVRWSFQHVRHDIWDYDTPSALVQTTKQSLIFVLDRRTGEPLFPIEERPAPASDVPGEVAAATQPFPSVPPPTVDPDAMPDVWWLADATSFGQCSRDRETYRHEGLFTPPSVEGTFLFPAAAGGNNWGGAAVDPRTGILHVNTSQVVQIVRLIPREGYEDAVREATNGSVEGGNEAGFHPQEGSPFGLQLFEWRNAIGLPCWEPPYGTFAAYDLSTGERLYEVPFGLSQQWGFYGLDAGGSPTMGGPVATAGGVVFLGASMDARVRALDAATGEELWSDIVAVSIPAVLTHGGADYAVFAVGGNSILKPQVADQVVAHRMGD